MVILVEDIWMWNVYLWEYFLEKFKKFNLSLEWTQLDDHIIYEIVHEFALSPKNREVDYFVVSFYQWLTNDLYINDLLLRVFNYISKKSPEKHEAVEKMLGFLNKRMSFFSDANLKSNIYWYLADFFDLKSKKSEIEIEKWFNEDFEGQIDENIFKVYKEISYLSKEYHGKDGVILYFWFFELCRRLNASYDPAKKIPTNKNEGVVYQIRDDITPMDCMYDKHTYAWKRLKRGLEHFVLEAWKLENEATINGNYYTNPFLKAVHDVVIKD